MHLTESNKYTSLTKAVNTDKSHVTTCLNVNKPCVKRSKPCV